MPFYNPAQFAQVSVLAVSLEGGKRKKAFPPARDPHTPADPFSRLRHCP